MPGFTPVESIGLLQQPRVALELSHAARRTRGLEQELPYIYSGYKGRLHALHRLRAVRSMAMEQTIVADLICGEAASGRAVGLTSAFVNAPTVENKPDLKLSPSAVEVSYWHLNSNIEDDALSIGTRAVQHIADQAMKHLNGAEPNQDAWMVTLPNDVDKEGVCEELGFRRVDHLASFVDADDGVRVPRYLWRVPLGNLIES